VPIAAKLFISPQKLKLYASLPINIEQAHQIFLCGVKTLKFIQICVRNTKSLLLILILTFAVTSLFIKTKMRKNGIFLFYYEMNEKLEIWNRW